MTPQDVVDGATLPEIQRVIAAVEARRLVDLTLYRNLVRVRALKTKPVQPASRP